MTSSPSTSLQIETFVCGPLQTNAFLLLDRAAKTAVVIDPSIQSDAAFALAKTWRTQGITLEAIWNTHGHFDHIYDNARWKAEFGAPIYAHPADAFFIENLREQAIWFGLPAPQTASADFELQEGQILQIGSHSVQILFLPGHSPGSVGFYLPNQELCIGGDVLFAGSVGRTDLPGCSERDLAVSVRQLFALPPQTTIWPGHGPQTTVETEKRGNAVARQLLAHF
jgi:glyoxylase-like metal-dependent hydrolase (beta-lactamase superfamily II)